MSPRRRQPDRSPECIAIREVLNRVGDKWSVLIVVILGDGAKRFSELKRAIEGISQRMLTLTLRGLERDGLVSRRVYATVPPRVEYELSNLGKTLLEPVCSIAAWAQKHQFEIQEARTQFDARAVEEASEVSKSVTRSLRVRPHGRGRAP